MGDAVSFPVLVFLSVVVERVTRDAILKKNNLKIIIIIKPVQEIKAILSINLYFRI